MAADKAEEHGVPMPQPCAAATAVLTEHIPDFGSARNPCDVTAQVVNNPQSLWACGEALLSDEQYGAIVMPQPVAFDFHTPRIEALGKLSRDHGKITCNVHDLAVAAGTGRTRSRNERERGAVPLDGSLLCGARRVAPFSRAAARRARDTGSEPPTPAAAEQGRRAARRRRSGTTLAEREAKAVLSTYGVPVVEERLVQSEDEAVTAARGGGLPGRAQGRIAGPAAQDRSRRRAN